jgi:hypothetical protein
MMEVILLPLMQEKVEEEENVCKDFRENKSHIRLMSIRRNTM